MEERGYTGRFLFFIVITEENIGGGVIYSVVLLFDCLPSGFRESRFEGRSIGIQVLPKA